MFRSHGGHVLLAALPPGRIFSSFGTAGLHQYFFFPNCTAVSNENTSNCESKKWRRSWAHYLS